MLELNQWVSQAPVARRQICVSAERRKMGETSGRDLGARGCQNRQAEQFATNVMCLFLSNFIIGLLFTCRHI